MNKYESEQVKKAIEAGDYSIKFYNLVLNDIYDCEVSEQIDNHKEIVIDTILDSLTSRYLLDGQRIEYKSNNSAMQATITLKEKIKQNDTFEDRIISKFEGYGVCEYYLRNVFVPKIEKYTHDENFVDKMFLNGDKSFVEKIRAGEYTFNDGEFSINLSMWIDGFNVVTYDFVVKFNEEVK